VNTVPDKILLGKSGSVCIKSSQGKCIDLTDHRNKRLHEDIDWGFNVNYIRINTILDMSQWWLVSGQQINFFFAGIL
jgi:hypothetical protein